MIKRTRPCKAANGALLMTQGCVWFIRNPAAHLAAHDSGEVDEQEAFEQLTTLSMVARMLDECLVMMPEVTPNEG
ncbi:TIGR02391 family protein [Amycolatopsis sp. NBC_00345]|uniref:TIGR02391 family protein n=1 Tax=Amycolatopsis sp. NBC_00345 TaxID=2975955 RepID=UPI002E26B92E